MVAGSSFVLHVPIDVSQVPDFEPNRQISVLAWSQGYQQQRLVTFQHKGTVTVTFELERAPDSLQVALGPWDATPFELRHLQAGSIEVPLSAWRGSAEVRLPAIRVTAWDWWSWQHWRQTFCVRGRVLDAQGYPIAGAAVSAFDVDAWWWWSAREHVGSAFTAGDGSFLIEFTRSCGWQPAWWWASRDWKIDAPMMERITSFVRQNHELASQSVPLHSAPSLTIFHSLLTPKACPSPDTLAAIPCRAGNTIRPAALEQIRERLAEVLPRQFPLPVWPWSQWSPWEDCGANLIFRVTEKQGGKTAVLVDEGVVDARWDIPASLDLKLIAREANCCGTSADWTLVDLLFPIAGDSQQRDRSGGTLSTTPGKTTDKKSQGAVWQ